MWLALVPNMFEYRHDSWSITLTNLQHLPTTTAVLATTPSYVCKGSSYFIIILRMFPHQLCPSPSFAFFERTEYMRLTLPLLGPARLLLLIHVPWPRALGLSSGRGLHKCDDILSHFHFDTTSQYLHILPAHLLSCFPDAHLHRLPGFQT